MQLKKIGDDSVFISRAQGKPNDTEQQAHKLMTADASMSADMLSTQHADRLKNSCVFAWDLCSQRPIQNTLFSHHISDLSLSCVDVTTLDSE